MYQDERKLDFKQVDLLLNEMDEKELVVMAATAQGLKSAREIEE